MMRLFLLTLSLTLFATLSNAQEICNNNLDDDGDGLVDCRDGDCPSKVCEICDNGIDDDGDFFIDCYDKECTRSESCADFFLGRDSQCEMLPDVVPPFEMKLKYKSNPGVTNHSSPLVAGDVDNDGIPELVTVVRNANTNASVAAINILQAPATATGTLMLDKPINTIPDGLQPSIEDLATADIDHDGCAEIFIITTVSDAMSYKIIAYNCNGVKIWANPISFSFYPGSMGLADFDGDGAVELYTRTQIFDAHSGALMGQNLFNNDIAQNSNAPVAVDILDSHAGLELVAGCRIYSVAINRPATYPAIPPATSVLTLLRQRNEYFTRRARTSGSGTSVADFNQDGYLDVLAVGSTINSATNTDQNTTIYFWDVQNDKLKTFIDIGTGDYAKGWKNGAGRINIADVDGDTLMNAVYVSGKYMYALEEGPTSLVRTWRESIVEETSGFTGSTMFDLNADGKSEIVYRDEDWLYIFTTQPDKTVVRSMPMRCSSRTYYESPIVVDMDGDGSAEICVTCSTTMFTQGKNLSLWDEAEVRVFESANVPWVPARKVWNQNGYFVTNVNDDLTIPRQQQLHHLIYAKDAPCRDGGNSRPLNSFMNQTPYLNSSGCMTYPTPNLAVVPVNATQSIGYTPFTCLDDSVHVTFKFMNQGDVGANGMLRISLYDGDPQLSGPLASRLDTKEILLSGMNIGDTITTTVSIKNPGRSFDLFIALNDDGSTLPLDIAVQPGAMPECYYDNVISSRITPNPAPLVAELLRDNLTCLADPGLPGIPNNGALKASVSRGATLDVENFNFYWSNGTTVNVNSPDYVGSNYISLATGAYTVYALHKTVNCASDTVTIQVNEITARVDASIELVQGLESDSYPDASLRAVVNDIDGDGVGDPAGNFNYVWYEGLQVFVGDTLGISHVIDRLNAGGYTVLVTDKTTGCSDAASIIIQPKPFGCPSFPAPDFVPVAGSIVHTPFTCVDDKVQVSFRFKNQGNAAWDGNSLQISFYNGDPESPSSQAVLLGTQSVTLNLPGLASGDTLTVTASITNPGIEFDLYVVLNDDGTTIPLDLVNHADRIAECVNNNVMQAHILPQTITLVPELVRDNLVCLSAPGIPGRPANGVVTAYVSVGNIKDINNFNFYWSNGMAVKPTADFVGYTYGDLVSGAYTVYAAHKTLNCISDAATVTVNEISGSVDARIIQEKDFDNDEQPNGELRVVVNDSDHNGAGDPENNFEYAWYAGLYVGVNVPNSEVLGTSATLTGLGAGTYSVLVFDYSTRCYDSAYASIVRKETILGMEKNDLMGVSIYPNPGAEDFVITVDNGYVGSVQLQLLSAVGNEVNRTFSSYKDKRILNVPVETRKLKAGVYLVKISLGKEVVVKKWSKL